MKHLWWLLVMACVVWYSTITIYVAIKGAADIKNMLNRLSDAYKNEAGATQGKANGGT